MSKGYFKDEGILCCFGIFFLCAPLRPCLTVCSISFSNWFSYIVRELELNNSVLYVSASVIHRFQNALISVAQTTSAPGFGTNSGSTKCAYLPGYQASLRYHECSAPMYGRYVRVTSLNQNTVLNLYEIEVHGWY